MSNDSGVVDDSTFCCVATSSEMSEIRQAILHGDMPCLPVIDCKMNDLVPFIGTLSAYFTLKSVFDQQGCRTLTFALVFTARQHSLLC